jgi:uncharacterized protein YecT (DUF1311 family)
MKRRVNFCCLIGAFAVTVASASFADPASDCDDFPAQTGKKSCSRLAFDASDAALNAVFQEVRHRLSQDQQTLDALVHAQESWDSFARAECSFRFSGIGSGSTRQLIFLYCMSAMTDSRTAELKEYLNCEEGSIGCPVPNAN